MIIFRRYYGLFLVGVIILFLIVFLCKILPNPYAWKTGRTDRARISFDRFVDLYSKKPQSWTLYNTCVDFFSYPDCYAVEFESYLDVLKYKRFRKKMTKKQKKEIQNYNQKDFEEELNKSYGEV